MVSAHLATATPMDEDNLKATIKLQVWAATGYLGGEITSDRRRAMNSYLGNPIGNEVDGRSKVVSSDVQDVVEAVMPDLMQIFYSADKVVRYEPVGPEDEETAKQATDYVNHVVSKDNNGFFIFHDWFKDALLQINGVVKVWWDQSETVVVERLSGLSENERAALEADKDVEILEQEYTYGDEARELMQQFGIDADKITEDVEAEFPPELVESAKVYDIRIKRTIPGGRIKIVNIPPEEFLISRRAVSLDDAPFIAHWTSPTVSELIEAGYNAEQLDTIPTSDETTFNEERVARFSRDDEWPFFGKEIDRSMREIRMYECYIRVDYDNDGVAELRKVTVVGPGFEILKWEDGTPANEAIDDHPFCSITPIRMPHKFFGRSLAELVEDIMLIKTSLWRSLLDNAYNVNNARSVISNRVSMDDVLNNRVAAPIRVDTEEANVGGHMVPMVVQPLAQHLLPVIEYTDVARETRTGVSRLGQGLDPDALRSTKGGISMLLGRTQQKVLLIAQVFANGGVRELFRKILRLLVAHQDKKRVIRLRGKFVQMDPRSWNAEMDVDIDVGLGRGTQDQQTASMQMMAEIQRQVIELQGGPNGPLVTVDKIYNLIAKVGETIGLRSVEPFFHDIDEAAAKEFAEKQGERPDPDMVKVQSAAQLDQAKAQADEQRKQAGDQLKREEAQAKQALEADKAQAEQVLAREQAASQMQLERDVAIAEIELKAWIAEQEAGLSAGKFDVDAAIKRQGAEVDAEVKRAKGEDGSNGTGNTADALVDALDQLGGAKKIVRDDQGRPSGIEPV